MSPTAPAWVVELLDTRFKAGVEVTGWDEGTHRGHAVADGGPTRIYFVVDPDGPGAYVEYYASNRFVWGDRRERLHRDGRVERHLETIRPVMMWNPNKGETEEQARREYDEHNRRVADELRRLGLYPEGDVNAYLRTNDVPAPAPGAQDPQKRATEVLVNGLRRGHQWFKPNQLAYLALTSKPEFVIRDQLAWRLHSYLGTDALVAREWQAKGKGAFHSDLAVLPPNGGNPILLLELKAMYTFDAIKKNREQFPRYVENDITKSWAFAGPSTDIYGLLLVVHPHSELPALEPVKFRAGANAAFRRHGAEDLKQQAQTYLNERLPEIGDIAAKGIVPAGEAFGVRVELLYWLIGPCRKA